MPIPEAVSRWIKQCLSLGHDAKTIKAKLEQLGYSSAIVDRVLVDMRETDKLHRDAPDHVISWVKQCVDLGHNIDLIKENMRKQGYDPRIADKIIGDIERQEHMKTLPDSVVKWIEKAIELGYDANMIKQKMTQHGYDHRIVDEIREKHLTGIHRHHRKKKMMVGFGVAVAVVLVLMVLGPVFVDTRIPTQKFQEQDINGDKPLQHEGPIEIVLKDSDLTVDLDGVYKDSYTIQNLYTLDSEIDLAARDYLIDVTARLDTGITAYDYKNGLPVPVALTKDEAEVAVNELAENGPIIYRDINKGRHMNLSFDTVQVASAYVNSTEWKTYRFMVKNQNATKISIASQNIFVKKNQQVYPTLNVKVKQVRIAST
ncbi:MAG: hypothetical protein ABH879_06190 [archaeon]